MICNHVHERNVEAYSNDNNIMHVHTLKFFDKSFILGLGLSKQINLQCKKNVNNCAESCLAMFRLQFAVTVKIQTTEDMSHIHEVVVQIDTEVCVSTTTECMCMCDNHRVYMYVYV